MKKEIIDEYLKEIPHELIKAVNPLSNEKNWAIFVYLMKNGSSRFSELKERFGAHQQELITKLNALMAAGLIERVSEVSAESFASIHQYSVTPLGKSLLRSMVKGVLFIDSSPDYSKPFSYCGNNLSKNYKQPIIGNNTGIPWQIPRSVQVCGSSENLPISKGSYAMSEG
jgi:DNA-binding HxlR family transcriptional regulator